jgi:hypothetical protein
MNVKEIVEKFLTDGHFDGLCNMDTECGCHMGDLFPCGEYFAECEPGYKRIKSETCSCQTPDDCIDFCICKEREEQ